MPKYAIYSCEGFSREILPSLKKQVMSADDGDDKIIFVDDDPVKIGSVVRGCKVMSFDELQNEEHRNRSVCVGIADPWARKKVVDKCADKGLGFFSIKDETHVRFGNVDVGEGGIFCAFTMATGDAHIGKHFTT